MKPHPDDELSRPDAGDRAVRPYTALRISQHRDRGDGAATDVGLRDGPVEDRLAPPGRQAELTTPVGIGGANLGISARAACLERVATRDQNRQDEDGDDREQRSHIRKTPNRVSGIGALSAASRPRARMRRVSSGSMTPSSHSRAVAKYGLPSRS